MIISIMQLTATGDFRAAFRQYLVEQFLNDSLLFCTAEKMQTGRSQLLKLTLMTGLTRVVLT